MNANGINQRAVFIQCMLHVSFSLLIKIPSLSSVCLASIVLISLHSPIDIIMPV